MERPFLSGQWKSLISHSSTLTIKTVLKLPGASGNTLGSNEQPHHPTEDRQYVSTDIHQQRRGNDIPTAELPGQRAVAVVHGEEYHLESQHLPGVHYTIAENESRVVKDQSDWTLNPVTFQQINQRLGYLEVGLFTSRLTHQLLSYASWRPDPVAVACISAARFTLVIILCTSTCPALGYELGD